MRLVIVLYISMDGSTSHPTLVYAIIGTIVVFLLVDCIGLIDWVVSTVIAFYAAFNGAVAVPLILTLVMAAMIGLAIFNLVIFLRARREERLLANQ